MSRSADKRRWALAVLLVPTATLAVFILMVGISSQSLVGRSGTAGSIQLSDVSLKVEQEQLYLNAQADVALPSTIQAGLNSGVPLDFVLELKLLVPRDFWFDKTLATFEEHFSLTYYELTRHYRVQVLKADTSRNYRSLSSALRGLGSIEQLPVLQDDNTAFITDGHLLSDDSSVKVLGAVEFGLDVKSLPLPLQPLLASSWRLASKEYLWPVN